MHIATGGNAKRMIKVANHILLVDSAYARRAEKARDQFISAYKYYEKQCQWDVLLNATKFSISIAT